MTSPPANSAGQARPAAESYSSPHLATIDGVAQVVLVGGRGTSSFAPADGTRLWEHPWRGFPIVQPAVTADGGILIAASGDSGTRRLAVRARARRMDRRRAVDIERAEAVLQRLRRSRGPRLRLRRPHPLVHRSSGRPRKWKGGRYGNGQLVLLPDQDLLLVLSEDGELALVKATPGSVHRGRSVQGDRGQDLEPPGAGRRRPARSQW